MDVWSGVCRAVREVVDEAIDLLYPPVCPGCDEETTREAPLCAPCLEALAPLGRWLCPTCAQPLPPVASPLDRGEDRCDACRATRPAFDTTQACWRYEGVIERAMRRAKYGGQLDALDALASALAPWLAGAIDELTEGCVEAPLLLAPPSPDARLAARGYNPAALLLERALDRCPATIHHRVRLRHDVLRRLPEQETSRAMASLGWRDRQALSGRAYEVARPDALASQPRVLLFDDVLTTGATARALASLLTAHGASRVQLIVAARAV